MVSYKGFELRFIRIEIPQLQSWGRIMSRQTWDLCLFKEGKLFTPLIETKFLSGGWWISDNVFNKGQFLELRDGTLTCNYQEPCPSDYLLDTTTAERLTAEVTAWNAELDNWKVVHYDDSYLYFDDSDNRRVASGTIKKWKHLGGLYEERGYEPEARDLDKELERARKDQWLAEMAPTFRAIAEAKWLEEHSEELDTAIADGGKTWLKISDASRLEEECARLKAIDDAKKEAYAKFKAETEEIVSQYPGYSISHSGSVSKLEVWVRKQYEPGSKATYVVTKDGLKSVEELKAFMEKECRTLPSGKSFPKKKKR